MAAHSLELKKGHESSDWIYAKSTSAFHLIYPVVDTSSPKYKIPKTERKILGHQRRKDCIYNAKKIQLTDYRVMLS